MARIHEEEKEIKLWLLPENMLIFSFNLIRDMEEKRKAAHPKVI